MCVFAKLIVQTMKHFHLNTEKRNKIQSYWYTKRSVYLHIRPKHYCTKIFQFLQKNIFDRADILGRSWERKHLKFNLGPYYHLLLLCLSYFIISELYMFSDKTALLCLNTCIYN